jgi:formylmethanofuran--tetrahydromethanopterin N-formyltransferase
MVASTNDPYCPTVRGRVGVASALPDGVNAVLEIVVDGLDRAAIEHGLRLGIEAACRPGNIENSAGNYGGRLGKHHFGLHALLGQ